MSVLSHPHRIRIVEELRGGEKDVHSLQELLGISHSGVSQHLALLRAHWLVEERREGRHVFYCLRHPELARWLTSGLQFVENRAPSEEIRHAAEYARLLWSDSN